MNENESTEKYTIGGVEYSIPVYDKYLGNLRGGRRLFANGELPEFKDFGPKYHEGISLRAFFDDESLEVIKTRALNPVRELAKNHDINIYSSDLWTPHVSIADLRSIDTNKADKYKVFQKTMTDPVITDAINRLAGQELVFNTLLLGPSIILAATDIPQSIVQTRSEIKTLAQKHRMQEKDINNIVHTTIARIARNSIQQQSSINNFGRGLILLHHDILKNPLIVRIRNAEFMANEEFEKLHESRLFKQLNTT